MNDKKRKLIKIIVAVVINVSFAVFLWTLLFASGFYDSFENFNYCFWLQGLVLLCTIIIYYVSEYMRCKIKKAEIELQKMQKEETQEVKDKKED